MKLLIVLLILFLFVSEGLGESVYVIPVPNSCVYVERVEKGRVYLKDVKERVCVQVLSFLQIKMEADDEGNIEVYYNGSLWRKVKAERGISEVVNTVLFESVQQFYDHLRGVMVGEGLTEEQRKQVKEATNQTIQIVKSEEFRGKVKNATGEILKFLDRGRNSDFSYYDEILKGEEGEQLFLPNERLYIFVSDSLPKEVIRSYVIASSLVQKKAKTNNIIFVLRGGINGLTYIKPTIKWVFDLIKKDEFCDQKEKIIRGEECELYPVEFQIDPFLYRRYGINVVPAVVYAKGVEGLDYFSEGLEETKVGEYYISYGDVSLFYHLYQLGIASKNQKLVEFAKAYLKY